MKQAILRVGSLSILDIGSQRAQYLTARLYAFARQAYPYDTKNSITIRAIQRNIASLLCVASGKPASSLFA